MVWAVERIGAGWVLIAASVVADLIDVREGVSVGIIGTAVLFAWRTNKKSKEEALADARSVSDGHRALVVELRKENRALREELRAYQMRPEREETQ